MAFKAGAIIGEARLDTGKWDKGLKSLRTGVGTAMKVVGAAFVAGMAVAIKQANDFQKAMSNVASITDEAAVNTVEVAKAMLLLVPALGDATESTEALYQSFSAGAETTEEAIQITTDAAIFAKAALTDTATAVDVLTTATNAYGKENVTTTRAADLFFTTVKLGKVTGDQLASTIGASIPLFASTGIELEQLTSGIAAMTKQGVNAANATTQLNAIVNAFIKPSEAMSEALAKQGIESGSALLESEGLAGALEFLEKSTGGNVEQIAQLVPNIRGLRGVMALTGEGGEIFKETLDGMSESAGSARLAFEEQEKVMDTLKNSMDNTLVVLGNIGKSFVDEVAKGASAAAEGFVAFMLSSRGGELVGNIVGFVAGAFAALKAAIQPIAERIGPALKGIMDTLQGVMENLGIKTEKAGGASKLLAVASSLIASGLTIAGKVIEIVIQRIGDMVKVMSEGGQVIGTFFKALVGKATFAEVREQARETKDAIANLVSGAAVGIADLVTTTINEFKTFDDRVNETTENVQTSFTTSFTNTKDVITNNWDAIVTGQFDFNSQFVAGMEQFRDNQKAILVQEEEDKKAAEEGKTEVVEEQTEEREQIFIDFTNTQSAREARFHQKELEMERVSGAAIVIFADFKSSEQVRIFDEQQKRIKALRDASFLEDMQTREANRAAFVAAQDENMLTDEEKWEAHWDKQVATVNEKLNLVISTFDTVWGAINTIVTSKLDLQTNIVDLEYDNQVRLLQDKLDRELISQERFDTDLLDLDTERAAALNAIAEKEFKAKKVNDISTAVMGGAQSIMGWWAQAPTLGAIAGPIFAGVMTGIVAAATIAQVASISQQQYVPRFQQGGRVSGGQVMMNEAGGEIATLPDGTIIVPNDISRQIGANSSGDTNVSVSFAGANISNDQDLRKVSRRVSRDLGKELRLAKR